MAPEPKRRKIEPPPFRRNVSSPAVNKSRDSISANGADYSRIQRAKNFAVAQAQQEGCTGNYRIFDSPFDNFLVPVVPTRAELSGQHGN